MGEVTPEWTAGFFDGEGTVDIRLRRTHAGKYIRFELRCQIVQRDRMPLELLARRFGGSVQDNKGAACGAWVTSSQTAAAFLRQIQPYAIAKAAQVEVALRFAALPAGKRGVHLTQDQINARLALMAELRGIRDHSGLKPKARNRSLQAEAAVFAVSRDNEKMANHRRASASRQDRGLH